MILFQYYRLKSEHEYFTIRQTHDHWKLFLLRLIIQLWSNLCRTFEKLRYQSRVWAFQRNQIIPGWNTRNHTSSPMYFIHELHKLKLRLLMNADTRINSHLWSGVEVYHDSSSSDTNPGSHTRTSETWPLYVPAHAWVSEAMLILVRKTNTHNDTTPWDVTTTHMHITPDIHITHAHPKAMRPKNGQRMKLSRVAQANACEGDDGTTIKFHHHNWVWCIRENLPKMPHPNAASEQRFYRNRQLCMRRTWTHSPVSLPTSATT